MGQRGFSLIELIVTLLIMGTLLAIVALNFGSMTRKGNMENEIKQFMTDVTAARNQALFQKENHRLVVTADNYLISTVSAGTILQKSFPYSLSVSGTITINFDTHGVPTDASGVPLADQAFCLDGENPAAADSIIIAFTRTSLGKRKGGTTCAPANIIVQ